MIKKIRSQLVASTDAPIDASIVDSENEAAVLIAITDCNHSPSMVLTRRASHMNSHAGEVAFPGGKVEPTDDDLIVTALRESYEEIGLPIDVVDIVAALPSATSKFGLQVTPFIGVIPNDVALQANEDELDSIFHVPLQFFIESKPSNDYEVSFRGVDYIVPCYRYEDYVIWGLTAYFIGDFLNRVYDLGLDLSMARSQVKKV
mgnify:FL=1